MPIRFLRFKPGAGGDTLLKLILASNTAVKSQIEYIGHVAGKTVLDMDALQKFRYLEIALLSLNPSEVVLERLKQQLEQLQNENETQQWFLKSHYYGELDYPIIDIIVTKKMLPFAVKGVTLKNIADPTRHNTLKNYTPLISKIKDKKIVHYFNCYNVALAIINIEKTKLSSEIIKLESILSGWEMLLTALKNVDVSVSEHCKPYYEQWILQNQKYKPSINYTNLITNNHFDYNYPGLDIEERYCLLALSGQRFKVLT